MLEDLVIRKISSEDRGRVEDFLSHRGAPDPDLDFFLENSFDNNNLEDDLYDIEDYIGTVGAFSEDSLIAVVTVGYSDDEADEYREVLISNDDPRILSNLYVIPEHRDKGVASCLVKKIVGSTLNTVFLYYLDDSLVSFYEKIGFSRVPVIDEFDHNIMFFDRKIKNAQLSPRCPGNL